jgi:SP family general alpha glucoside:H+ symporter-like MFS transporter
MSSHEFHETSASVVVADNEDLARKLDLDTIKEAAQADEAEHSASLYDAFRIHKKAIFWSMALSGALIMEGYDVVVVSVILRRPGTKGKK